MTGQRAKRRETDTANACAMRHRRVPARVEARQMTLPAPRPRCPEYGRGTLGSP
jgi:hypothetical protein